MLILTRKEGESIILNIPECDQIIKVQVMRSGTQVSPEIDAPLEVEILREELVEGI